MIRVNPDDTSRRMAADTFAQLRRQGGTGAATR
jgi:hypothetical protein